jgi:hypothetical protein
VPPSIQVLEQPRRLINRFVTVRRVAAERQVLRPIPRTLPGVRLGVAFDDLQFDEQPAGYCVRSLPVSRGAQ